MLFGDPYQLAPVPGDADERAYFADHYRSMWFFDARVWDEAELRIYELGTIHRQHELEFKQLLNAVRHGAVTAEMAHRLNTVGARPAPVGGRDHARDDEQPRSRASTAPPSARLPGRALIGGRRGERRLRRPRLPRRRATRAARSARR